MANCDPNEQRHDMSDAVLAEGCTKAEALRKLEAALLARAEKERKVNCDTLQCVSNPTDFRCTTRLELPPDFEQKVQWVIVDMKEEGCSDGVGYQAIYLSHEQVVSRCVCIRRKKKPGGCWPKRERA